MSGSLYQTEEFSFVYLLGEASRQHQYLLISPL